MVEVEDIRGHKDYTIPVDHDGDGSSLEGLSQEVLTMHQALYAAIQAYSLESAGVKIVYDPHNAPHFFIDTNENGAAEPDETMPDNAYQAWTPRALRRGL